MKRINVSLNRTTKDKLEEMSSKIGLSQSTIIEIATITMLAESFDDLIFVEQNLSKAYEKKESHRVTINITLTEQQKEKLEDLSEWKSINQSALIERAVFATLKAYHENDESMYQSSLKF